MNADELVNRILDHSDDRIRFNTKSTSGELRLANKTTAHIGRYQDSVGLATTPHLFNEELARIEYNGAHPMIKAAPENAITVQYQNLPGTDSPRTMRVPPGLPAPLFTPGQLRQAVTTNHENLRRGVTRAYLTDHETRATNVRAHGTEIGFSNQAIYEATTIPMTSETTTYTADHAAHHAADITHRIDITNTEQR